MFTREEKDFLTNVLRGLGVQAGQADALKTVQLVQAILTKLTAPEKTK